MIPHGKSQLYAFSFSFWASEISLQLLGPFLPKSEKPIWDYSRWGSPGWTSTFGIIANQCSSPNRWLKKWKELSGEAILVWAQLVSVKSLRNPSKMWKKMNKIAFFSRFLLTVRFTFFKRKLKLLARLHLCILVVLVLPQFSQFSSFSSFSNFSSFSSFSSG